MEVVRKIFRDVMPEGRFKDYLRDRLSRYYSPLEVLSDIVASIELLEDRTVLVGLKDGVRLYAEADEEVQDSLTRYCVRVRSGSGNSDSLTRMEGFEYFGTLWRQLIEQYRDDIYQRYYKVNKGDIIVDVGAHIGTFALRAARAVGPGGLVIAIEPEKHNIKILERNIKVNRQNNVVVVPKGAWSRKDRPGLFIRRNSGGHSMLRPDGSIKVREVEVDMLDNILGKFCVKKVDLIKMDIEGAEIEAYKGMKETLKGSNVKLAVAAYHKVAGRETYKTIAPLLRSDGFKVRVKQGIVYAVKK